MKSKTSYTIVTRDGDKLAVNSTRFHEILAEKRHYHCVDCKAHTLYPFSDNAGSPFKLVLDDGTERAVDESVFAAAIASERFYSLLDNESGALYLYSDAEITYRMPIPETDRVVYAAETINIYNIQAGHIGNVYNFQGCKFDIMGDLRSLSEDFRMAELIGEAKILEDTARKVENNISVQTANDVTGSGIFTKARKLLQEALNPDTTLHKRLATTKAVLVGIKDLYNFLANSFGWPPLG